MRPLERLAVATEWAIRIGAAWAITAIVFLFLLIFAEVVFRFKGSPIPGEIDIVEFTMAAIAFLGLGYAQLTGAHVRVEAIAARLPHRFRRAADVLAPLLSAVVFVLFARLVAEVGYLDWQKGALHYGALQIPLWIRSFLAFIGLVGLVLALLVQALRRLIGLAEAGS